MQIEIGKRYVNKTWRFLLPCLKGHGDTFVRKFNPLFKLAVGINDNHLLGTNLSKERNIFILIDRAHQTKLVDEFIQWIKYQPYYKHDYCAGNNITDTRKHVIVISVPEIFNHAYDMFLQGRYSEMYTTEEIILLFSSPDRKREYDILMKSSELKNEFIRMLNSEFNTSISDFDTHVKEYELPLITDEEVFNYRKDRNYFKTELNKI